MKTIVAKTTQELGEALSASRSNNTAIGLVPTMGALHQGHLSLIERSIGDNPVTVVSIFVNPIQFNNKEDLQKYPRTLEADLALLDTLELPDSHKLIVFAPSEQEMYPEPVDTVYHFGAIEEVMEGPRRPGHFSGVAVVVRRLFDLVQPRKAYFGEKDYQQIAIIRELLRQIKYPIELVACPIVRADDGLALSSRNKRLSPEARAIAPAIYATLSQAAEMALCEDCDEVKQWVADTLNSWHLVNQSDNMPNNLCFEVEYVEIVDGTTLQPLLSIPENPALPPVICIAVWLDGVRLIDMVKI
ncbi:MAG: pantoate--beta-alanine ligase [Bacteroidales bacterium]|nr:pantoate--beta-alanine ligase [Bacteroidales bacterium]